MARSYGYYAAIYGLVVVVVVWLWFESNSVVITWGTLPVFLWAISGIAVPIVPLLEATPFAIRRGRHPDSRLLGNRPRNAIAGSAYKYLARTIEFLSIFWGILGAVLLVEASGRDVTPGGATNVALVLALVSSWVVLILLTPEPKFDLIASGIPEYRRVLELGLVWLGLVALGSIVSNFSMSSLLLVFSFVFAVLMMIIGRIMLRKWLAHARSHYGAYCLRALICGGIQEVELIERTLETKMSLGLISAGTYFTNGGPEKPEAIIESLRSFDADVLILCDTRALTPDGLKELGWQLDPSRESLMLAGALVDVAGPRITQIHLPNLALVQVDPPRYLESERFFKRIFDVFVAIISVVLLSPVFLLTFLLVRLSSKGPAIYRQVRVGFEGKPFVMLKFRTMVNGTDNIPVATRDESTAGNEVLFKLRHDPRTTRIGRWLRKHSIDELPQLFNVISGDMSLVGPRPPLPEEVEKYAESINRRFLVRPGITGLWQVSGRSDLNWQESVRLDLIYVENWSFLGDLRILLRTIGVTISGNGAY